jgi:hypothetical protein
MARICIPLWPMRTTAEVLLALLPAHHFAREQDADTGFDELVIRPQSHRDQHR